LAALFVEPVRPPLRGASATSDGPTTACAEDGKGLLSADELY
jgi:hypothetical protein